MTILYRVIVELREAVLSFVNIMNLVVFLEESFLNKFFYSF